MEFEQIIELIDHVAASGLSAFTYEADGMKLSMKGRQPVIAMPDRAALSGEGVPCQALPLAQGTPAADTGLGDAAQADKAAGLGGKTVNSPLVGTFYVAPAEGAEPYVRVGDTVKKGQVIAIVEAMKLMNEIESEYDGVVTGILVQDGEPVEYGQPLFCIE